MLMLNVTVNLGVCLNIPVLFGDEGTTPLVEAVRTVTEETSLFITQLLLVHGADPNLEAGGRLPLHEAVRQGRQELVALLLNAGAQQQFIDRQVSAMLRCQMSNNIIILSFNQIGSGYNLWMLK